MAKKTTKKVVTCETCGEYPCACVEAEVKVELKLSGKPVLKLPENLLTTIIDHNGYAWEVDADGKKIKRA